MKKPLRVLILEDREPDAALLLLELRRGYDVDFERVQNAAASPSAWSPSRPTARSWRTPMSG